MDRESLRSSRLPDPWLDAYADDGTPFLADDFPILMALKTGKPAERKLLGRSRDDGKPLWLQVAAEPLAGIGALVSFDDITEFHLQSCQLDRLTHLYAALSQVNQAIVWSATRETLLDKICEVMVTFGRFRMAWVGWNDPGTCQVRVVSSCGDTTGYLDGAGIRSDDTPLGRGGTGTAIREGRTCVLNDFLGSGAASPWHGAALKAGFRASASIPVRHGGQVCGALVVYASSKDFFGAQELGLLEEAAGDVAFALDHFDFEVQRKQMEEALKESEYFFRESQRTAAVGSYKTDFTTGMWKSSEVLDAIFGIDTDYHRSVEGWLNLVHPDDRNRLYKHLMEEVLAGRKPFSSEYRIVRNNDGETRWVNGLGEVKFAEDGTALSLTGTIQDISDRKRAEAMLLDNQARLQRAESVANFGHWQLNLDEKVILASEGASKIYGLAGAEWSIQSIQELPIPEHRSMLNEALANLVDHQRPYNVEFRIMRTVDGQFREIHSIAEYDPGRRAVFGVIHDITERKQAENALHQEKTFTRALLDNQIEGVVACDERGELVLFNRTLATWQGMDPLKLPKEQWAEHYDLFQADGTTPLATQDIPLIRAFSGEVIHDAGLVIRAKDHPPRHVLCNGSPILDEKNQKLGAVVVMHDITQQKHDEEAMRKISVAVEQSPVMVVITDALGRIEYVNPKFTEVTGYTAAEAIGQNPRILKSGHFSPEDYRDLWTTITDGRTWEGEFHNRKKNGDLFWEAATIAPIKDNLGRIINFVAIKEDITEFKRVEADRRGAEAEIRLLNESLEQRVQERTAQFEAANKEMEAFSYSVSHDLRAPLRSIDGFSQVLLEDCQDRLDEAGRRYLARIRSGTQRMGHLIDDLLKLSKTSRSLLTVTDCDLSRLCGRVAGDLADLNPERRIEVIIQPGMRVQVDHHLMQVVLENLLGNAWKFTSKTAAPRIEVGERVSSQEERAFFIRDNGAGFAMAHVDKLFNAFQRLHAATDFEGTGIGLAIVQRIIHRHHGRIWAEAEVGNGATFFFTLPG